jgi:hypothetical protein
MKSDRDIMELVYGLLWHDKPQDARRLLSEALSGEDRGHGIAAAKLYAGTKDIPRPVEVALKALDVALGYAEEFSEMRGEELSRSAIGMRSAAILLERWAMGGDR